MQNFTLELSTKILFGRGQVNQLSNEIKRFGNRVLLVYGGGSIHKSGLYAQITEQLKQNDIYFCELSGVQPNPRITSVRQGVTLCRENNVQFILSVGGGSSIDCAKVVAAAANYAGDAWDFAIKKAVVKNPLPIGTILTLAATGSEMNAGAVVSNDETQEKFIVADEQLRPRFSILDPEITFTVNGYQTAAGTADIMSHLFEQYFSPVRGATVQDCVIEALLKVCIMYGPRALQNPEDYDARANLMWASSLALNGLVRTGKEGGDWAAHLIEHELSVFYDMTHGIGLALLTPYWMEYVLSEDTLFKFVALGKNVWNVVGTDDWDTARKAIASTRDFFNLLGIPSRLSEMGIDNSNFERMSQKASRNAVIGNFKRLTASDVLAIYNMAL